MSPLVMGFITSALLPSIAAMILIYITGNWPEPRRTYVHASVFAAAFMVGAYLLLGRVPEFPPHDVGDSVIWSALVLAVFIWVSPRPLEARYALRALFVVGVGALAFWQMRGSFNPIHYRNLLAFFFLGLGLWSILERSAYKVNVLTLLLLPLLSASSLSLLLLVSASASMAQLVSIVCTLLGGLILLAIVAPKRLSVPALLPFVSVFLVLFMACGHFYLDINPWYMIYLCVPYAFLWIRDWLPIPRGIWPEAIVMGLLSGLPLAYFMWNASGQKLTF